MNNTVSRDIGRICKLAFKRERPPTRVSEEKQQRIYENGYHYNKTGHFEKAIKHFSFLSLVDPDNPKYTLGLAMVLHQQKAYKEAILLYIVSASKDIKNPMPRYHLADCYMNDKRPDKCYQSLLHTIELCGDQERYAIIKERSQLLAKKLDEAGYGS